MARSARAVTLPCARCGDPEGWADGADSSMRYKGEPFGYRGKICRSCYVVVKRHANGQYRPQRGLVALGLARLVLAFAAALDSGDGPESLRRLADMKAQAAAIVAVPEAGKRG